MLAQLRVVSQLAQQPLYHVYELFRLPSAPAPAAHVACVPVYDVAEALSFLGMPEDGIVSAIESVTGPVAGPPRGV